MDPSRWNAVHFASIAVWPNWNLVCKLQKSTTMPKYCIGWKDLIWGSETWTQEVFPLNLFICLVLFIWLSLQKHFLSLPFYSVKFPRTQYCLCSAKMQSPWVMIMIDDLNTTPMVILLSTLSTSENADLVKFVPFLLVSFTNAWVQNYLPCMQSSHYLI